MQDRLIWKHTPHGQFSVKSGYQIAKEKRLQLTGEEGSSATTENERTLWGKIWGLNIKKKVQHFLWRACNNCLPTGVSLQKRGIRTDGMCKHCGEELETIEHLFFHCPKAQLIWKIAPVSWEGMAYATDSFKGWWLEHGKAEKAQELQNRQEITAYIMWQIWKARNALIFGAENRTERDIIRKASEEWLEFKYAQPLNRQKEVCRMMIAPPMCWQKPDLGCIKLNTSSETSNNSKGEAGLGIVARGDQGELLQFWSVVRDESHHPVATELEATRAALLLAQQNGWTRIEVQLDIKAIVDCLQARRSPLPEANTIADDIFLLMLMFETCKFSFGHRKFNKCSSELARLALRSKTSQSWKTNFPLWLQMVADSDVRSVDLIDY